MTGPSGTTINPSYNAPRAPGPHQPGPSLLRPAGPGGRHGAPPGPGSPMMHNAPRIRADEMMHFTPLGAGSEVGRSCHILKFKGKTIMLDCGAHPAYNGLGALPFFDEIDPETVDLVLITHFHIDHCASLPYLMEKTMFKGRVFMTHPTKAIFKWMMSDYVRVSASSADDMPYDEHDLQNAYDRIEAIDFHQVVEVEGVRFTAYNAGHVLGAAMFLIEVAGVRVLYTGDYSREEDRHLMSAEQPRDQVDVLVCESTYGVQNHTPRAEREALFTSLVHQIVSRGGRCLIPIFALGRAQELLLILEEYWAEHPELQHVPIYYASNLARKCMAVYETYVNMMNQRIRKQFAQKNPFKFQHVSYLKNMASFDDVGPCVMMASPAMLQSGLSRELLELWCPDRKNGLIIPGYVVEGTLGKHILSQPTEITSSSGSKLPMRCTIDYISFSAHVDFAQNREFIELINPTHLILVHGETNMMTRLRNALQSVWGDREDAARIYSPKNAESVALHFKGEKYAKALGELAATIADAPVPGQVVQGLVVGKDFNYHLVSVNELREFTDLRAAVVHQRQYVPLESATWDLVVWHLELVYPEWTKVIPAVPAAEEVEPKEGFEPSVANGAEATKPTKSAEDGESPARVATPDKSDADSPEKSANGPTTPTKLESDDKPATPTKAESGVKSPSPAPAPAKTDSVDNPASGTATPAKPASVVVCDVVRVTMAANRRELIVEWDGNPVNDVLADSVLAVLLHVESSPASVKMTTPAPGKCGHNHAHHRHHDHGPKDAKMDEADSEKPDDAAPMQEMADLELTTPSALKLQEFHEFVDLANQVRCDLMEYFTLTYDQVEEDENGVIIVSLDGMECRIDPLELTIECENDLFKQRMQDIVERIGMVSSATWLEKWVGKHV
ncbi:hypothetical protein AMAG_04837 [Allomyces macrogynus ATCC 38327]|uniref:Endoribonuclease YSH1 n=1 Tax=Allomyces macrogynus (strain ATCC 38327) TaxID=578462 RepID=A0A0L0S6G0_ALLM3|nr:hypothetical protein AMAG_04837 [Allomyces macrogynus ATCC 38327]|eukprot:KNE58010.1 hypothetical protein AMAG_04837 [Allomyces macrogynus ATCC 38327]